AYVVTKRSDRPSPDTWAYAAGDDERGRRTGHGPIDVAWHDGRIYVSRGDVCLLSAPLAELPDAAYLEGRTKVKGMAIAHSTGVPPEWVAA
ncbi:hypothetical protein AB9E19_33610, partial [Rhizobium leguminosarum]|uniref:hypothetical protein n=1 Tax=Rhizobium leguminosarum TaxID=384 RepID=UPI003F98251C